ncbi:Ig-like domain-containing protein [Vibrio cholerae]
MDKIFKSLFLLMTSIVLSLVALLSGCNLDNKSNISSEPEIKLQSIDIKITSPTTLGVSELSLAAGNKQPFEAVGYYNDGSSKVLTDLSASNWQSSDRNVGYFDVSGILTAGKTPGLVSVYVSKDGVTSNKVNVQVTAAVITHITITVMPSTPPLVNIAKGQTQSLKAEATYSDDTSSDVTNSVIWMSTDPTRATVSATGVLTGVEQGSTTLTASKDGIVSNTINVDVTAAVMTKITITESNMTPSVVKNMPKGSLSPLTAMATYSDNTSSDVTKFVMWKSADPTIANVNSDGILTGVKPGSTTITASKDGITSSNAVIVNVNEAVITNISITPSSVSIAKGQSKSLSATAVYSDGKKLDVTKLVTWRSLNPETAAVDSYGVLTGMKPGDTTITASQNGITSSIADIKVTTAVIIRLSVKPELIGVVKGRAQPIVLTALYSDNTVSDVTERATWHWGSQDNAVAQVMAKLGRVNGIAEGITSLEARLDGIYSNRAVVSVCENLAGNCIDIMEMGDKSTKPVLYTSSPSLVYITRSGIEIERQFITETGRYGPSGTFYVTNVDTAKKLCSSYNIKSLGGRTNWRLATKEELWKIFSTRGNVFRSDGWPTAAPYRSSTVDTSNNYFRVNLYDGYVYSVDPGEHGYASCISNP